MQDERQRVLVPLGPPGKLVEAPVVREVRQERWLFGRRVDWVGVDVELPDGSIRCFSTAEVQFPRRAA